MQEKLSKDFLESHLPSALKSFQKLLEANEGGQGFFVGKKVLEDLVNFSYSCIGIELPVVSLFHNCCLLLKGNRCEGKRNKFLVVFFEQAVP